MKIFVLEIKNLPVAGNLKGFAIVQVGPWTIRGVRIIQQPDQRPYVALPQEASPDGRYFPIITTTDANLKEEVQAAVLQEWSKTQ